MQNSPDFNQQLMTFRYLKEQRDMLQGQIELVNASYGNLINTKTTLGNLKDVKDGDDILLPIGGMFNLKATIKEPEKVLFYVSQDIIIEKSIEDSIESIEKLMEQHKTQLEMLTKNMQNIDQNLQAMSQNLQRGYAQP